VSDIERVPVVATIGNFDGVHLGHQELLREVVATARTLGVESLCITFSPHPQQVLVPERAPLALTSLNERVSLLRELGVDGVLLVEFSRDLSTLSAEAFLDLVQTRHRLVELLVGPGFAIGRERSGTLPVIREIGARQGFAVHEVPPVTVRGEVVSSTRIRRLLSEGDVRLAAELLGRPYRLAGRVLPGARRGRAIGFPTANFRPPKERALPAEGVYAVLARVDGRAYPAVAHLGRRPTVGEDEVLLEAHLLDFHGDLYEKWLEVEFIERVRGTKRFDSVEELRRQIVQDVEVARARILAWHLV